MSKSRETLMSQIKNNSLDYKTEIIAGLTTFLSMAYIIVVNPYILSSTGMPLGALVTATCLTAGVATIFMGIFTNTPLALASGMGMNAFFAFSVVKGMNIPWGVALGAVFVEGIIFIILSLSKAREGIVNAIPVNLRGAMTVGIGFFIAFIGFVNSGIIVKNDATLVGLGRLLNLKVLLTLLGLVVIFVFELKRIRGSILFSICITTLIAWCYALFDREAALSIGIRLPDGFLRYESIEPIFNKLSFSYMLDENFWNFIFIVLILLCNDLFDTVGTLVGVASKGDLVDDEGKIRNADKILLVDAISTTFGAVMGVSPVTTYVESSTGIAEGGRTGFTSVVTGSLLILSVFFAPLFIAVPASATSAALIYVGFFMCKEIKNIDFSNMREAIPSFLILFLIPLTYSIASGIGIGIIFYVIINVLYSFITKKSVKIAPTILLLFIIFILKLIFSH
ncbi:Guanine-hypoxanthine permease (plasmid) [Borrelia nietonii YOR]|uniref:Guanine-hypoxanthine permease n=2 Tax=Borrelia TaxID=138 RepID=W5SGS4_9SPIR|nr:MULTISPECIES: NCS2 family permease [Borrelia]AHH04321.1 Guanine-hypoxanthine permease [Borrelia nietonii YOR]AHH14495.1 Guanine-hypoxanthine permease [Borrelia hermsii MTW]UPA09964.1 NCS2 family permease [Borrelia nietonii YOR]